MLWYVPSFTLAVQLTCLTPGGVNMALLNILFVLYNWNYFNSLKLGGYYMYCQV